MNGLVLGTLRYHRAGFVASFIALFFGASIVIACGSLLETGVLSDAAPQRLAAAPIVVTGDPGYPGQNQMFQERVRLAAADVAVIAAVPGVTAAVPDVSFPVTLVAATGQTGAGATGHAWDSARLGRYALVQGSAPESAGQVALDARWAGSAGIAVGRRITLDVRGEARQYVVSALVTGLGDPGTVFLSDQDAAGAVAQPGTVDSIGVFTATGVDRSQVAASLRQDLQGQQATVLTGDQRGRAEFPAVVTQGENLISMSAVFGGLAAMVTVFVVAGTLGLSVQQRQRELALLRAVGATSRQVRRMVLGETLVLSLLATGLACLPAAPLGRRLLAAFAQAKVVPVQLAYRGGWIPMLVGAAVATVTALGAAFVAGRAAARVRPAEALAEAALQRRWFSWIRLLFALLFLGGAAALAVVTGTVMNGKNASSTAIPAAMLVAAGMGLLGPGLTRAVTAVLSRPLRAFTGLAGSLALLNAKARPVRLAGAVMPVMLATGLALAMTYIQTTQSAGAERQFQDNLRADLVVGSATGGLPLSVVDAVAARPGVAAASAYVPSSGFLQPTAARLAGYQDKGERPKADPVAIEGVSAGQAVVRTTAIRAVTGDLSGLSGNTVALPASVASSDGYRIGDSVPMRLGDGIDASPTLVATTVAARGYQVVLLPASVVVAHSTSGLVPQILVKAVPGTGLGQLTDELAGLAATQPGLRVANRSAAVADRQSDSGNQAWLSYLLVAVVVGYAVISLVNTLVLAAAERRREFTLQRLIGSTRGQVLRMMTVEGLLTALAGIILGGAVAAVALVPLSRATLGTLVPTGPVWILAAVSAAALSLTLSTTLLSTGFALRSRLTTSVGADD
ncbi:FtsX-like permease family protein [Streptacidiphilus sp. P02-A3a]|uniref:ABC transporter permease n=1 Tax=Streptacidiphilus sp. P02-A3a TaxID=2704468 RepID=UPI0015FD8445|nr:FtsX-like permease family protein [Streptacidiphilus sp. P02-A3a]QMU72545.1 FtsX-like permease family protein [Streptacidiphilus sp. P02-A3a]